jgi:hypothetical protein
MVGRSVALVGEPAADTAAPIFDRYDTISLIHRAFQVILTPTLDYRASKRQD